MAINLLELLKSKFSGDMLNQASKYLGENPSNVTSALNSSLPVLIGGVIQKSSTTNGASSLFNMITNEGYDGSMLNNTSNLFSGENTTSGLIDKGKSILDSLFGNKLTGISDSISSTSGMKAGSITSLLAMAAPLLMNYLGKEVKSGGLNASSLATMLGGQASFLKGLIPAGLMSSLGLGNIFGNVKGGVDSETRTVSNSVDETKSGLGKILPWIIGLAILGLLAYFLSRGCNKEQPVTNKVDTTKNTVQKQVDTIKKMTTKSLPGGTTLSIPPVGVEASLIEFIEDKNKLADKETWFSFDRLYFKTDSAALNPQSKEQLKNIADIMNAYPNVELKIGGYTDNTGDPKANLKLSQQRAESTMKEIVALGIKPARLKAEGYGQEHPIADNNTESGRAKNRRIDVRVSKK